jgi:hypothetical protein
LTVLTDDLWKKQKQKPDIREVQKLMGKSLNINANYQNALGDG